MNALYKLWKKVTACVDLRRLEPQRKGQLARLPRAEAHRRIDGLLEDCLGCLRGHFFNLHAAGLRGHKHQLACRAVQHDAQIELAIDCRCLFNQQTLHLLPVRAGLVRHQLHAKNVLDVQLGVFARAGYLHSPAFAASAGMNLRFHHHATRAFGKQFAGHRRRFFRRIGHFAPGHGHAVSRQDFLCLIFVNFHNWSGPTRPLRLESSGLCPKSTRSRDHDSGNPIVSCGPKAGQTGRGSRSRAKSARTIPLP